MSLGRTELVMLVALLPFSPVALGQPAKETPTRIQGPAADHVVVGQSEICMPTGVFLLVRREQAYGAIRFTAFQQGNTGGTGSATYEAYYQDDGSGSFVKPNAERYAGRLVQKPLAGIGRLAFARGNFKLRVGRFKFEWHFRGCVSMYPYNKEEADYGYEFAPTAARAVVQLDVRDPRMRWFRYEWNRKVTLSVDDLPR